MNSSKKVSITLDSGILGIQKYGGISNYWNRLIENIISNPNFDTNILLPKKIINLDFNNLILDSSSYSTEFITQSLARYFKGNVDPSCSIFHTGYYRLPNNTQCTYIVTVYDFIYERYGNGLSRLVHSFQKNRALKQADAIICISESTRQDAINFCPSIDPSKFHVVHLAVDHEKFYPDPLLGDDNLKDTVLWVGQRGGHKRFDLAVKALNHNNDLKFGIVGPSLTKQEIILLEKFCFNRWHYLGSVNETRLRQIYSSVFALIYPSDYEGFGLPILEAMACGCPVLAAKTSSLPEVGGNAAVYANSQTTDDYSANLKYIKSNRSKLVKLGIDRAKLFTWHKTIQETIAIYLNSGDLKK